MPRPLRRLARMNRDAVSGLLLIVGGVAVIVLMGLHPTGHGLMNEQTFDRTALLNMLVHAVAIAATPVLFLGLLGAARRLGNSDLAIAALVAFGFGGVAVVEAALASGFIFPGVIQRIESAQGSDVPHAFLVYTGLWNQAHAKVQVVAWSIGTLLLAAAVLRNRSRLPFAAAMGVAGVAFAIVVLFLFLSGHVRMDLHGARIIYFAQAGWLAWLGLALSLAGREFPATSQ